MIVANESKLTLFILGMHRSGTSALAGVISNLGFSSGDTWEPDANNQKGYFENKNITLTLNAYLESIQYSWDDSRPLPIGWHNHSLAKRATKKIEKIFIDELIESKKILIKDPRVSRLYPLFVPVLEEMNLTPKFIISLRHPLEVAKSLSARDGFDISKSLILYILHLLEAERNSRLHPRIFVVYDELLNDWKNVTSNITKKLSINFEYNQSYTDLINDFLSFDLRHHRCLDKFNYESETLFDIANNLFIDLSNGNSITDYKKLNLLYDRVLNIQAKGF